MKNIHILKKYCAILSVSTFLCLLGLHGASAASLSASTSLTVVHLTKAKPQDISTYPGSWPRTHDETHLSPTGQEVYISNVHFNRNSVSWSTIPRSTPYPKWPNGVNSIVTAVWSKDQGKTFQLQSWDYLGPHTSGKHIVGSPDCWMGTMVSSLCGQKAGECNGENRSNLFFSVYPSGAGCWGDKF